MTLHLHYPTKKALKGSVGHELRFDETSIHSPEYKSTGIVYGCNEHRNWFAQVTMLDDTIVKVK